MFSSPRMLPSIEILFPSFDWGDAKIHVAQKAGDTRPIDVFTRSFDEWQNKWNGEYHSNHCWNRKYIFSMIELPNCIKTSLKTSIILSIPKTP